MTIWGGRVLILAHVKELLEQNADKVRRLCPEGNNLGRIWGILWEGWGGIIWEGSGE